jgi:glyceraldehyde 3-phosphate dehydrogenase
MSRVAINGLGRIGRAVLKLVEQSEDLELVAANDLVSAENLAYLLRYDTAYGRYGTEVGHDEEGLRLDGRSCPLFSVKDPAELPWGRLEVDTVFECTGVLTEAEDLRKHMEAGAKHVLLSAPSKSDGVPTVVHGVNRPDGEVAIRSCASCTTNCITPVMEVLARRIGVRKAAMTTVHAYTSTQSLVDGASGKTRRGRAAAQNFVPSSTGAALATARALPSLEGRFDGIAVRGPVVVGSLADIVVLAERPTSVEEVNGIFREESETDRYLGILGVTEEPIVSSDVVGEAWASLVDLGLTRVIDGDLLKVMSWYDNEWGYASQMVREAQTIGARDR